MGRGSPGAFRDRHDHPRGLDDICITNFNRQLHAMEGLVGVPKATAMADRMRLINPMPPSTSCRFSITPPTPAAFSKRARTSSWTASTAVTAKCHLLSNCRSRSIPIVTATGAGGRLDPTQVEVADLALTDVDPLARTLRKLLRRDYGFPAEGAFGIPAVFSKEPPTMPHDLAYDGGKGFRCVCPKGDNPFFNCDERNLIMGNAAFVTGAFGLRVRRRGGPAT